MDGGDGVEVGGGAGGRAEPCAGTRVDGRSRATLDR